MPLNRQVVIAEAARLADEEGFPAITVAAVARRLGVQTASLYSHVTDRADLLDGVTEIALGEIAARLGEEIAGRAGREALLGLADVHRSYSIEAPGRWAALQRRPGAAVVTSAAAADVVRLTQAVLRGYRLPEGEEVHAARMLGSAINGFLSLEQVGSFDHRDPSTAESWTRMIEKLHQLFTTWGADQPEGEAN